MQQKQSKTADSEHAIETLLYYRIRLREALELPNSTEGMLYPHMSGITEQDLTLAQGEIMEKTGSLDSQLEILLDSPFWTDRIRAQHTEIFYHLAEANYPGSPEEQAFALAEAVREKCKELTRSILLEYDGHIAGHKRQREEFIP